MPRKKKSDSERVSESYVPVNPEQVKNVVEVAVKEIPQEQIIKIEKQGRIKAKPTQKKIPKLRARNIREETEIAEPVKPKSKLKLGRGYTLIITEKPQAAQKISQALGNSKGYMESGAAYYELERDGKKIIVACAVGHLFSLVQQKGERGWPVFNIEWKAEFKKNAWAKKYYNLLVTLCKQASDFIVATDYDVEGEVIGMNIIRFICKQKDAKRMKFSSLTKSELEEAYSSVKPTLDWGQGIAGETRHYLDWFYGINLSRALMEAIKQAGSFRIMSIGRVQGPALHIIVEKEIQIQNFKSEPYWQVFIIIDGIELKYNKDITKKSELIPFKNLKGKTVKVKTEKIPQNIRPPAPFDLTTLQIEAYKFFSINPSRTLQIAQNLYLAGLISYPRTSSQKIPESISPRAIINRLGKAYDIKLCVREKPAEGAKSDPAHPSIYPTGEYANVPGEEKKIYELIVRRFLSCFCEDAEVENKIITALLDDYKFVARGLEIKKRAWMDVYKTKLDEKELPDINGDRIIEDSRIEEKTTQPPRRYSPASLVSELAKRNLGTKATRAAIVETLYNRGYIKEQSIKATPLGISLVHTLEKNCPIIIDQKLTRNFEKEMDSIQTAKKNLKEKQEKIIKDAKSAIIKISQDFKKHEKEIGKELVKAGNNLREEERKENELTICPACKKNKLRILYNRKSNRNFVACSGYPECKTTFSLPPNGLIKPSKDKEGKQEFCEKCNFPLMLSIKKGKRPWKFCFNPECPTRNRKEDNSD
jgi:DNA topoisomerase-1